MKAFIFTFAVLVATASASGLHQHGQLHAELHKKGYPAPPPPPPAVTPPAENATCGCTTVWTTWTGPGVLIQPAPTAPPPPPSAPAASQATYSAAPPPPSNSSWTTPGYVGSGKNWAIAYSPYQGPSSAQSSCKSSSQVMQDISAIAAKGFSAVRIYATDCNQVEYVGNACKQYGLKMIVGIYIASGGICQDTYNQLNEIVSYFNGNYELVELMAIGNEALFNGYCTGSELASFISHCTSVFRGAGYTGPITTTDTVAAFQANSAALCPVIDVVAANMYSFFNGNVQPQDSASFIAGQVQILQQCCPNKEVYNLECGWPTQGPNYINAVPSPENQAAFIQSILGSDTCGHTVFFTTENDYWKNDGSYSVEPYFGCLSQFS